MTKLAAGNFNSDSMTQSMIFLNTYTASLSHPHTILFLLTSSELIGLCSWGISVNTSRRCLATSLLSHRFSSLGNSAGIVPRCAERDMELVFQCHISPLVEQVKRCSGRSGWNCSSLTVSEWALRSVTGNV